MLFACRSRLITTSHCRTTQNEPYAYYLPHVLETLHFECIDLLLPVLKLAFCMRHMQSVLRVCVRLCTDPGQLLLQGLLGGLRAAVQLGALLTHTLSQPLYSVPLCLQQLTRLAHTHIHAGTRTIHRCKRTHAQSRVYVQVAYIKPNRTQTQTHTHMGQRR